MYNKIRGAALDVKQDISGATAITVIGSLLVINECKIFSLISTQLLGYLVKMIHDNHIPIFQSIK